VVRGGLAAHTRPHFHKMVKILTFYLFVFTIKSVRSLVSCASRVYLWLHIQSLVDVIGVLVWPDQSGHTSTPAHPIKLYIVWIEDDINKKPNHMANI
jgi:RecB family endonuclease NucS